MNVLSLFDGISCGRVALERAGVPVANYYASEIDKHAIKIAKKNYPDTIHLGDVTKIKGENLPKIDLIIAGSPCQGFSNNGHKKGFEDPRSKLFWEFVRLVEECKPTWWFLENVRMKKEWINIINNALGCEPILINSALVSAQRRMRLYWTNIPNNGLPEDKGIILKDILEKPIAEEQPMTDKTGKCYALTATYHKCGKAETGEPYKSDLEHNIVRHQRTCVLVVGQDREVNTYGRMCNVYSAEGKAPTLLANSHGHNPKVLIKKEEWRMLTPKECERLQTLPDDYTAGVSNTQRYKALGNGWTVDIITHFFKEL